MSMRLTKRRLENIEYIRDNVLKKKRTTEKILNELILNRNYEKMLLYKIGEKHLIKDILKMVFINKDTKICRGCKRDLELDKYSIDKSLMCEVGYSRCHLINKKLIDKVNKRTKGDKIKEEDIKYILYDNKCKKCRTYGVIEWRDYIDKEIEEEYRNILIFKKYYKNDIYKYSLGFKRFKKLLDFINKIDDEEIEKDYIKYLLRTNKTEEEYNKTKRMCLCLEEEEYDFKKNYKNKEYLNKMRYSDLKERYIFYKYDKEIDSKYIRDYINNNRRDERYFERLGEQDFERITDLIIR